MGPMVEFQDPQADSYSARRRTAEATSRRHNGGYSTTSSLSFARASESENRHQRRPAARQRPLAAGEPEAGSHRKRSAN